MTNSVVTRFCFALECGSREAALAVHKRYQHERAAWKADRIQGPLGMGFFMKPGRNKDTNNAVVISSGPDGDIDAAIGFIERLVWSSPMKGSLKTGWANVGPTNRPGTFGGGFAVIDLSGDNPTRYY